VDQTTDQAVTYQVQSGVAWITINRPEERNVVNAAICGGLFEWFAHAGSDDDAKVVVITGAGDRVFCTGSDLGASGAPSQNSPAELPILGHNVEMPKPTIAAVNGTAYDAGFLLAQMCDLCISAHTASFAITAGAVGHNGPWATPLSRLVPPRVAMQLLITGVPIDAARARDAGLVNEVVSLSDLRTRVQSLGELIGRNAPLPIEAARRMVYDGAS
jgi:enoyl-CoA hydratase/carnithine racemase